MELNVFDVEHGACALLTCDNGAKFMIDCGQNSNTGWLPGTHLRNRNAGSIDMLAITNYDEDHVSGIENLFENVVVRAMLRNQSVSASTLCSLKSEDGMGNGIKLLAHHIANTFTGPPVDRNTFSNLDYQAFWNEYPTFDDENNLSVALFLKCYGIGVLFTGDLEAIGWRQLLRRDDFRSVVRQTNVLIASHHGRISGWVEELRDLCKPYFVVISDKGYMYDTQETVPLYRSIAKGGLFRGNQRHVLTTRRDSMISFTFEATRWWPH